LFSSIATLPAPVRRSRTNEVDRKLLVVDLERVALVLGLPSSVILLVALRHWFTRHHERATV